MWDWRTAILGEVPICLEGIHVTARTGHGTIRLTPQRCAVLEALRASNDHPTAAELLTRVQQDQPGIGPATIYRTLNLLVTSGLAVELQLDDGGAARYDGNVGRHDHLVCVRCGRIDDVVQPEPDLSGVADTGFAVTGYDLRINGVCPSCQESTSPSPGDRGTEATRPRVLSFPRES